MVISDEKETDKGERYLITKHTDGEPVLAYGNGIDPSSGQRRPSSSQKKHPGAVRRSGVYYSQPERDQVYFEVWAMIWRTTEAQCSAADFLKSSKLISSDSSALSEMARMMTKGVPFR